MPSNYEARQTDRHSMMSMTVHHPDRQHQYRRGAKRVGEGASAVPGRPWLHPARRAIDATDRKKIIAASHARLVIITPCSRRVDTAAAFVRPDRHTEQWRDVNVPPMSRVGQVLPPRHHKPSVIRHSPANSITMPFLHCAHYIKPKPVGLFVVH